MDPLLERAKTRRERALEIIEDLDLLNRWSRFGDPVIVGSVSLDLVVAPDIDLEVYADAPQIGDGFQVMAEVAESPNVVRALFENEPSTRGKWFYWEVRYRDTDGEEWTIETYHCAPGDPCAHFSEELTEAMLKVLTNDHRVAILRIKEALCEQGTMKDHRSFDIYRGVMEGGVRTIGEFSEWVQTNKAPGIVRWLPVAPGRRPEKAANQSEE